MNAPVHESTLPACLTVDDLAALLGISRRSVYLRMSSPAWPFSPIPGIGKLRWSRDHVLSVITHGAAATLRRRSA